MSYEPALGPVDLSPFVTRLDVIRCPTCGFSTNRRYDTRCPNDGATLGPDIALDWVIVGGESGPGARPCDVQWIRSTVEQCRAAGVACFVKQIGARPFGDSGERKPRITHTHPALRDEWAINDRKGGDPAEWPADLRVREMPDSAREP